MSALTDRLVRMLVSSPKDLAWADRNFTGGWNAAISQILREEGWAEGAIAEKILKAPEPVWRKVGKR